MSSKKEHEAEIKLLRTELKKLRDQIRGMRAQHVKDMAKLKEILASPDDLLMSSKSTGDYPLQPIGFASTWHQSKNGTPRQGCIAKSANGIIDVSAAPKFHSGFENPQFSLDGLTEFSHVWIIFYFHQNSSDGRNFVKTKVAPPRLGGDRVGLFSTRSPHRPNPIGLTLAKLIKVENSKVYLQGLDLLDGTPILDIKPYIPNYDAPAQTDKDSVEEIKVPDWIRTEKSLKVQFTERALSNLSNLPLQNEFHSHQDVRQAIVEVLEEDPRSNYRKEKCSDKLYFFSVDYVKVTCWFDSDVVEVVKINCEST